jgi:hypothetical protein
MSTKTLRTTRVKFTIIGSDLWDNYARGVVRHKASTILNSALGRLELDSDRCASPAVAVFITANALIASPYWRRMI